VPFDPPTGGLVRFEFSATVDQVSGFVPGGVRVGDPMIGYFSFDPSRTDGRGAPTFASYYFNDIPHDFEMHVTAANLHVASFKSGESSQGCSISVQNDEVLGSGEFKDMFFVQCSEVRVTDTVGFLGTVWLELSIFSFSRLDAITSLALPLVPPRLDLFEYEKITIAIRSNTVHATLTSLTAAP